MKTHVSYSEISDFRQCKLKHRYGWVEGWRQTKPARALRLGTLWHQVMEAHYVGSVDGVEMSPRGVVESSVPTTVTRGILKGLSNEEDFSELLKWMFLGYRKFYKGEDLEILDAEETWVVELPNPRTHVTHLKVKLDLVARLDGRLVVMDHKSGAQGLDASDLEIDPQFAFYVWAARQKGFEVDLAVRNWAKTARLKRDMTLEERFIRHEQIITEKMLDRSIEDLQRDLEIMALGHDTRSPGKDCSWKCSFRDACRSSYREPADEVPVLIATGHTQGKKRS